MAARTVGIADAERDFREVADAVSESGVPVTVTRDGKPHVMIVPATCSTYEERAMNAARDFLEIYKRDFELLA